VLTPDALADLVPDTPPRPSTDDGPLLVTGIGPGDWRGAPDLFLRVAAALPGSVGGRPVRFTWLGLDPRDGRSYPYLYDAEHLGLTDRLRWEHEPEASIDALGASHAVVLTGRAAFGLPVHPFLDAIGADRYLAATGVPCLAFATPVADGLPATVVDYPDLAALVAAVLDALARPVTPGLGAVVDPVVDHLLGGAP
jgi:hypothetical protein